MCPILCIALDFLKKWEGSTKDRSTQIFLIVRLFLLWQYLLVDPSRHWIPVGPHTQEGRLEKEGTIWFQSSKDAIFSWVILNYQQTENLEGEMSTGLLCIMSLKSTQKQTLGLMSWLSTEVARHQHQQPEFHPWNPCDRRKESNPKSYLWSPLVHRGLCTCKH